MLFIGGCAFWYGDIWLGLLDCQGALLGIFGTSNASIRATILLDTSLDFW